MRCTLPCLIALVGSLFATVAPSAAQPSSSASAGQFDYFLLSLSIAPSFCALSPANAAKDECRSLTDAAFQQTPLTVHGLWPNITGVGARAQPQDCAGPRLEGLPGPVQAALDRYMPAGPGLKNYEWRKHGICTGLSPEAYFAAVARLAGYANDVIGGAMRDRGMLGRSLRIADLLAAVAARDAALADAIVVDCRAPRGGGQPLVDEIRIVLKKDLSPLSAASVGFRQNSGCPRGQGVIPAMSR